MAEVNEQDLGINPDLLSIRISKEAKQWDSMADKIIDYLQKVKEDKLAIRSRKQDEAKEKQEEVTRTATLRKQGTGGLKSLSTKNLDDPEEEEHKVDDKKKGDHTQKLGLTSQEQKDLDVLFLRLAYKAVVFKQNELDLIGLALKQRMKEISLSIVKADQLQNKLVSFISDDLDNLEVYKVGLVNDLHRHGKLFIKLIQAYCIEVAGSVTPVIFLTKLQGDISRYMTEHASGAQLGILKGQTLHYYRMADAIMKRYNDLQLQKDILPEITSLRLSVCLNYAVFLYRIYNEKKRALSMLKTMIGDALDDFANWKDKEAEDIKKQIELMQENVNLWSQTTDTESEEDN